MFLCLQGCQSWLEFAFINYFTLFFQQEETESKLLIKKFMSLQRNVDSQKTFFYILNIFIYSKKIDFQWQQWPTMATTTSLKRPDGCLARKQSYIKSLLSHSMTSSRYFENIFH